MNYWTHRLPGLGTLRRYEAGWLPHDIFAGLVLATMLVPVGIAYAQASGLPGIYGLYATITPLLAYALFGPSRILVLGPDSALAVIILGVVVPLSGGDPLRAVTLAGMMAIVSGTICILAGIAIDPQRTQGRHYPLSRVVYCTRPFLKKEIVDKAESARTMGNSLKGDAICVSSVRTVKMPTSPSTVSIVGAS